MPDDQHDETPDIPDDATPKARDRIIALAQQGAALRAQLAAVAPKLAEVTALQSQLAAATEARLQDAATWAAKEQQWQTDRALVAAGITDPEAADIVAHAYGRVAAPEGGTKPSLPEWLAQRDALPKGVRAYLPDAAVAPPVVAPPVVAPPVVVNPPPRANAGAGVAAPLNGPMSSTEIQQMMQTPEGRARYQTLRTAHLASLK
jgi:hypothetical protein